MRGQYVVLEEVRPMVIALLQAYGPTEAVAKVTGVPDKVIKGIYSRQDTLVSWTAYDKIEAAYKKIPQRRQPSRD